MLDFQHLIEQKYNQSFSEIRNILSLLVAMLGYFPAILSMSYLFEGTTELQRIVMLIVFVIVCVFAIRLFQFLGIRSLIIKLDQLKYEEGILSPEVNTASQARQLKKLLGLFSSYDRFFKQQIFLVKYTIFVPYIILAIFIERLSYAIFSYFNIQEKSLLLLEGVIVVFVAYFSSMRLFLSRIKKIEGSLENVIRLQNKWRKLIILKALFEYCHVEISNSEDLIASANQDISGTIDGYLCLLQEAINIFERDKTPENLEKISEIFRESDTFIVDMNFDQRVRYKVLYNKYYKKDKEKNK